MDYIVSDIAKLDIEAIFEYSNFTFGIERTIIYMLEMEAVFRSITMQPQIGTLRQEIAPNLYAIPYQSHMIYYELQSASLINIVRIIHGSRDINMHIP